THKQGGGVYLCSLSVLPSSPLCVYPDRVGVSGACPDPVGMVNLLPAAFSFSPLVHPACSELPGKRSPRRATPHSPLTPIIPAPLATAALRVVPAPIFTTTLSTHVGAPTILFRERTTASQQFPDRRAMLSSNCALLTVDCELLRSPNPNHSRTYEPGSRKSFLSRTYAKQGGGGRYLSGNVPKNVGAPTFSLLHTSRRSGGPRETPLHFTRTQAVCRLAPALR